MKTLAFITGTLLLASPLAAQLRVDNNYKDLTQRSSQRDDRMKKRQQEAEAKKKAEEEAKKKAAEEARRREWQQAQARRNGAPGQPNSGSANNQNNPNAKDAKGGKDKQGPSKGYGATEPTGTEVNEIMLNAVKTRKVYFNPERMAEKKSVILLNPLKKPVNDADQIGSIVTPL